MAQGVQRAQGLQNTVMPAYIPGPPATRSPLVSLRGVSRSYRSAAETTRVFDDLDLELRRGAITCLVGPSGCGKSTIISLIAGLMRPDAGQVCFDGQNLAELSDAQRAHLRATRIGMVLQSGNLLPFLSAAENIALAARLAEDDCPPARIERLLEQVGLTDRAEQLPRRLSGGEAQRVALAAALVNSPELLLADEAVGQLDSTTTRHVMTTLQGACRERDLAVLLVTHSPEVAALGSHVMRLVDGRLEEAA